MMKPKKSTATTGRKNTTASARSKNVGTAYLRKIDTTNQALLKNVDDLKSTREQNVTSHTPTGHTTGGALPMGTTLPNASQP